MSGRVAGLQTNRRQQNQQNPNLADRLEPKAMLENGLGPLASAETRAAVTRAESKQQGLALLLMAPEFQRR